MLLSLGFVLQALAVWSVLIPCCFSSLVKLSYVVVSRKQDKAGLEALFFPTSAGVLVEVNCTIKSRLRG